MSVLSLVKAGALTRRRAATDSALNITGVLERQAQTLGLPRLLRRPTPLAVLLSLCFCAALGCSRSGGSRDRKALVRDRADERAALAAEARRHEVPVAIPLPALPEEPPAGAAPTGGTLRVHLEAEPPHLNPLQDPSQTIGRVVSGLVYEPLLECRAGRYAPALAESWETTPDGLKVTFKLRPARWQDDRLLTALDVQATLEGVLRSTSRVPVLRASLVDVAAVEVMPERSVRVRLQRPAPIVLRALCDVPILPEALTRGSRAEIAQLSRQPVGTGPFRVVAWERGKRIRLARYPQAWRGPARLEEIVFEIDPDGQRALGRVRRGEIDILPRVLDVHYPDQVTPAALGDRIALLQLAPARFSFLEVNSRHPPLDDVRFRQALSMLWNRPRLVEEAHRGLAQPIGGPPFGSVPAPAFDLPGALRLLDEAGHTDSNGDGVRDRAGMPVRLTFVHVAGSRTAALEAKRFAADLRRAGLLVEIVPVDAAALLERLRKGDFDLAPMVWEGRPDEDPRPLFGAGAEFNHTGSRSERIQGLIEEIQLAPDPLARAPILGRLAVALAEEVPVVFLYRHDAVALAARRVHGLSGEGGDLDLRGAWVDP
jgi:peptide/nickel transport system substrate-binding protein